MNYDEALKAAREAYGKREITDEVARTLCAAWQSPGGTGWTLAAVASGSWAPATLTTRFDDELAPDAYSRGKEFRQDLYRTFKDAGSDSDEMIVWSMLGTWSLNGFDE